MANTKTATKTRLPLIVEPDELERHLGEKSLLIVDLGKPEIYAQHHIPGAASLNYAELVAQRGPAKGMLPDDEHLTRLFSSLSLTPQMQVVAYDNEGGGRAARLLWTLDAVGHPHFSLLNGGLQAWLNEGHPTSMEPVHPAPSQYRVSGPKRGITDVEYILAHLKDREVRIVDVRGPNEYSGVTQSAQRNGHIPGAINLEWTFARDNSLRLKPFEELKQILASHGISPDKQVIVHCQTHHRSAHTYIVLKALAYPDVKGYAGSWSEWGNRPDTPVETGAAK
jgi:thiosulfate/3-mercaptopyruvate sulfurtransferase